MMMHDCVGNCSLRPLISNISFSNSRLTNKIYIQLQKEKKKSSITQGYTDKQTNL
jgi:hypothetical protein